jgi:hypothetical protein
MDSKKTNQSKASKKSWRIFHFEERFEMDKRYRRQGGLDFVRMFVTSTTEKMSNESSSFMQQLTELEHYYPNDRDALEGRFWRLCRLTATKEDWLRGYLLDSDNEPLTASRLAARLHLSLAVMKKTLTALKKVGLLEYINMPQLNIPKRVKSDHELPEKKRKKTNAKTSKKSVNKAQKAAQTGDLQTFANVSESFKNSKSNKIESEAFKETLNNIEFETEGEIKPEESGNQAQRKASGNGTGNEPPTSPTTAPSIGPNSSTKTDAPGMVSSRNNAPARTLDLPKEHIGKTIDIMQYRYDKASNEFAVEMMYELGFINAIDLQRLQDGILQLTREQAKERGNWSAAWYEASGEFSPETLAGLKRQLLKRLPKAKGKDNPAGFLRTCWKNLCVDARRKTHKARASM